MSQRNCTALLLVLGALGVASLAALRECSRSSATRAPSDVVAAPATPEEPTGGSSIAIGASASPAGALAAPVEQSRVASPAGAAIEEALWVEGRVRFPVSMPPDEAIDVVARSRISGRHGARRARVSADGSFRIAIPKEPRTAWLDLDAPHLFLEAPVRVDGPLDHALVLEPTVGALITGCVVPPVGAADASAIVRGKSVQLNGEARSQGGGVRRVAAIGADLRFELRGVPSGQAYRLQCDPGEWPEATQRDVEVAPGQTLELELRFRLGARIAGRIVDDEGRAIASAGITVHAGREPRASPPRILRQSATNDDGCFAIAGLEAGALTLVASRRDYLAAGLTLDVVQDGEDRVGLELELGSGNRVTGWIVWPDGRPAGDASVSVEEPERAGAEPLPAPIANVHARRAESDGSFRVAGLGAGPFSITAQATERLAGRGSESWHASAEGVAAGSSALRLVLQSGQSISGRAVDDTGAPITRFTVQMRPHAVEDGRRAAPPGAISRKFAAADGGFAIGGLRAGSWDLVVRARGFVGSEAELVRLPDDGAWREIVLPRAATISGRVIAPDGSAVQRATVVIATPGPSASEPDLEIPFQARANGSAITDAAGSFTLEGALVGELHLVASRPGFAASEPRRLDLRAGARIDGVELRLRRGGRLAGEVSTGAGTAAAGWRIELRSEDGGECRSTIPDADGRFRFEDVPIGRYSVTARPEAERAVDARSRASRSVEIRDSETAQVVLHLDAEPTKSE